MEKNYNKLSTEYDSLLQNGINDFLSHYQQSESKFCVFYPSFGIKPNQKCDFIIYGQALNGWNSEVSPKEQITNQKMQEIILKFNGFLESENHTPLDWVNVQWDKSTFEEFIKNETISEYYYYDNPYFVYRSFFWNVVYKLITEYYNLGYPNSVWAKHMVWSNLYKISYPKRNPDAFQKQLQLENAVELFKKEIEELNPKYCILITNQQWFDDFNKILKLENELNNNQNNIVTSKYSYLNTKIIVTTRPFQGNSDNHVKEIIKFSN